MTSITKQQNQARYIADTLPSLNLRTADFVAEQLEAGAEFHSVDTSQMADGSGRLASLVRLIDPESTSEWLWRVSAPAPVTAPAWAQVYGDYAIDLIPSWLG